MANSVYLVVCDALSHIVSRRAAENIVRDALRTIKSDPDAVTAREMQDMLKGQVFARLQQIIPVAQARGEIKTLLQKLEVLTASEKPSLSPEVLEGLEALRAEFAPFVKLDHRRVKRIRAGIEVLPEAPDPVRALNSLWAELDLLFNEIGPDEPQVESQADVVIPVMITSEMINPGMVHPEMLAPAVLPKPSAHPTPVSGVSSDGVLEIADDLDEELGGTAYTSPDHISAELVSGAGNSASSNSSADFGTATVELGRYELPDALIDPLDDLELDDGLATANQNASEQAATAEGTPFLISEFDEFGLEFELEEGPESDAVETEIFATEAPESPEPVAAKLNPNVSAEIDPAEELRRALEEEAALRQAFDEEAGLQSNASAAPDSVKPETAQLESSSEPNHSEPGQSVPSQSEPGQSVPGQSVPGQSVPVAPITAPSSKTAPSASRPPATGSPATGSPATGSPATAPSVTPARKPAARRTTVATQPRPQAALSNEAQELLIARFALEEGVIGVAISNRAGQVSLSRMREGSAEDLAGMSAATAMLLESQRSFDVFYTDLGVANVFIAPLGDSLLTVLADKQVNVGRVLSEVKTVKEEI
jgi:hypothetical protein